MQWMTLVRLAVAVVVRRVRARRGSRRCSILGRFLFFLVLFLLLVGVFAL